MDSEDGMSTTAKWILGIIGAFFGLSFLFFGLAILTVSTTLTRIGDDYYEETSGTGTSPDRVAIVDLDEPITSSEDIVRQFRKWQNRGAVKAIVLRLNSPGGAVAPSQEIFAEVKRTVELGKPVVVSMSSIAASGAYYIACGASKIVANPGTITGSIGVISQFMNIQPLLEKVGIRSTTIKSGKFKDVGNPTRAMTDEERAQLQSLIDDVYAQFIGDVARSRGMSEDSVRALADGRVYTGKQAYDNHLVDTLGTLETAVRNAGFLGNSDGDPRVLRERPHETFFERLFTRAASGTIEELRKNVTTSSPLEYRFPYSSFTGTAP
jgi:protease-4